MTFTEYVRRHFLDVDVDDCISHYGRRNGFLYEGRMLCTASQLDPFTHQPEHQCPYQHNVIPFQTVSGQILLTRCSLEERVHRDKT